MRPCPPSGTGSGVISSSSINVARTAGSVLEPRMVFSLPHCPTCLLHHPAPFHLSTPPNLSQTVRPPLCQCSIGGPSFSLCFNLATHSHGRGAHRSRTSRPLGSD